MPIYLKFGDIKGEVKKPAHRSWIELKNASFGAYQSPGSGSIGRGNEPPRINDILVTKKVDNASVQLYQECVTGNEAHAVIDFLREGGGVDLRIEMSGTLISSYSHSGSGQDKLESLTLNFRGIKFTPKPGTPPP